MKKIAATLVIGGFLWNPAYANAVANSKVPAKVEINAEDILHHSEGLRGEITRRLDDENIQIELKKMGIEKSEVQMRLAAMSDQELQQVQQGVQRQAGGDVIVLSVTTFLLIIIIILLLR